MSSLVKIPANNMSGFGGRQLPACGGVYERGAYASANESVYTHKIDSKVITAKNGTRQLVNHGTQYEVYPIKSGQGLNFGGTQYFGLGITLDLTNDFTLPFVQQSKFVGGGANGCNISATDRAIFTITDKVSVTINEAEILLDEVLVDGDIYSVIVDYEAATGLLVATNMTTGVSQSATVVTKALSTQLLVGAVQGNAVVTDHVIAILKDVYVIPYRFTDQERVKHHQQPESTVYVQDGVIWSSFLSRSVIELMQAGQGVWFAMCETSAAGNVVYDMSKQPPTAHTVTNADNSEMKTNAQQLTVGLQQALVDVDENGIITGLRAESDALRLNGKSPVAVNMTLDRGDWFLDVYAKANPNGHGDNWPVFTKIQGVDVAGDFIADITIWYSVNGRSVNFGGSGISKSTNTTEGVYSIEWIGNVLKVYDRGVLFGTSDVLSDYDHFIISQIGVSPTAASSTINGSLYLQAGRGQRTDTERADHTSALMRKFRLLA